jgi:O-antigen/teichoic acid export membrane protein
LSSIRSNFAWNTSYQVVRILTPIITTPYLARVLGSEALGTYSYTYTVATYFTYFCLLGLQQYGNREIAKCQDDKAARSRTFCSIFAMQLVTGALVTIVYLVYVFLLSGSLLGCSLMWLIWVVAEAVDISWFFYGLEQFRTITIRNLVVRLALIVCIFAFVHDAGDLIVYCGLQASTFAINSLILWLMMRGKVNFVRPTLRQVAVHIKPNLTLFAPIIAISIYTQLNEIILGAMGGMSEVAYYDNAYKIVTIPLTIIQSLGTVMLPRMSNIISARDEVTAKHYIDVSSWLSQAMAFGLAFGIAGIAPEFVPVFFGPGYDPCVVLMPLFAVIIPICAWSNVMGVQYLIPHERDRQYLISVLTGAAMNVALCALLVGPMGAVGAAVATACAELTVSVAQSAFIGRALPLHRYLLDVVPFAAVGLAEYVCVRLVGVVMGATVLGVACQVVIGGAAYLVLSFVWLKFTHDQRLELLLRR